jgi:hypothetical protein
VLFIYVTRLASNKIHREVGRTKDVSAPLYETNFIIRHVTQLKIKRVLYCILNVHNV